MWGRSQIQSQMLKHVPLLLLQRYHLNLPGSTVITMLASKRLFLQSWNPEQKCPKAGVHCYAGWYFGLSPELRLRYSLTHGKDPWGITSRIFKIWTDIPWVLTKSSKLDHKAECTVGSVWGMLAAKQLNPFLKSPMSHYLHDSQLTDGLMPIWKGDQFFNCYH